MIGAQAHAEREQGYALIAALWLLLLAASLAGILMLRTVEGAKSAAAQRTALIRASVEESALQTAAADLMLNGASSRFGPLPSTARYQIGKTEVLIAASRESDRLDVNDAALPIIDTELQVQGVSAGIRSRFLGELGALRARGQRLDSVAALEALMPDEACAIDVLTPHGGRTAALPVGSGVGAVAASSGLSAWRLQVSGHNAGRRLIVRPGLAGQQPLLVLEAMLMPTC